MIYIGDRKKKRIKRLIIISIIIIICIIFSAMYKIYGDIDIGSNYEKNIVGERTVNTIEEEKNQEKTVVEMLDKATRTVVGVSKTKTNTGSIFSKSDVTQLGIGSGIIVSEQGYILTNEHVSGEKYSTCYVMMENGTTLTASVVWSDSHLDLSLIKVNSKMIDYASLGDSNKSRVGETVYAIGNPIGYEFQKTVTSGIISAINRTIILNENNEKIYMDNLIQTDATINPGNSGGPLLNLDGQVIGINTIKITSAEGIGFAVPINVVKPIIKSFEENGSFDEGSIGILVYDKNVIPYLDSKIEIETGVYVVEVDNKNSNLQVGDIILKVDEISLEKINDLREYLYSKKFGDEVKLSVLRNRKNIEINVKLIKKR